VPATLMFYLLSVQGGPQKSKSLPDKQKNRIKACQRD